MQDPIIKSLSECSVCERTKDKCICVDGASGFTTDVVEDEVVNNTSSPVVGGDDEDEVNGDTQVKYDPATKKVVVVKPDNK